MDSNYEKTSVFNYNFYSIENVQNTFKNINNDNILCATT